MKNFNTFWLFLSNKEKLNFFLIVFFSILQAFLELLSIAAVIPFITILLKPEELNNFPFIISFLQDTEFLIQENLIIILCLTFCLIFLIKNIFIVYINKKLFEFIFKFKTSLHLKLLNNILHQDYLFYVEEGFSKINNILSEEVANYCLNSVRPMINLFREFIICFGLLLLVFYAGFLKNLIFVIPFAIFIAFVLKKINRFIKEWSKTRIINKENLVKYKYSLIHGIKEILINGNISRILDDFKKNYLSLQNIDIKNNTIGTYPRALLEQTVVIIFIFIIIFMNTTYNNLDDTLIVLSFYLAVSYRLLPTINNIAVANQQLKFGKPSYNKIYEYYSIKQKNIFLDSSEEKNNLVFEKSIRIENLTFSHNNKKEIFKNLSFNLNKNEIVGIFGESGSGKSSFLDILTQLIKMNNGSLFLDNKKISEPIEIRKYQNLFTVVTQDAFLYNESILENIILDNKKDNYNKNDLNEALKFASLEDTIKSFPEGINTKVGSAHKRISSGQKQRIAIARSYYGKRKILILDEATNALDEKNERRIFENLKNLKNKLTIIIISHKTENLKICDKVYKIENKRLININS